MKTKFTIARFIIKPACTSQRAGNKIYGKTVTRQVRTERTC